MWGGGGDSNNPAFNTCGGGGWRVTHIWDMGYWGVKNLGYGIWGLKNLGYGIWGNHLGYGMFILLPIWTFWALSGHYDYWMLRSLWFCYNAATFLAPPAERQRSFSNTDLSVFRLSVCPSVRPVRPSVRPSVRLSVRLSVRQDWGGEGSISETLQ